MGSEQPVCPACGQPVEMVVRRQKTLGAWVPVWVRGPCRNPKCGRHPADEAGQDERTVAAEESGTAESAPARGDAGPAGTRR
ncbi:hypothetical protein ABZS79_20405 [Streptomyces griseoloalbus]|uniref:hypothetical protein n=1 Tax=Streptomyces griseoloalbus TaxID=67303 RepID=UPI0033BECEA1